LPLVRILSEDGGGEGRVIMWVGEEGARGEGGGEGGSSADKD